MSSATRNFSPIILFAYNRPEHFAKTLEALKNNTLAGQSDLFIYSDAPKKEEDYTKVKAVRQIADNVTAFHSVTLIKQETNLGLADSVIIGVTNIVNQFGKVIVLEDDIITSKYFLEYMNDALNFYETESRVMHISGYMYPVDTDDLPEYFFLKPTSCWGWATWKRAWDKFEKNPSKLVKQFDRSMIRDFNMNNTFRFWQQITANATGRLNTWAIFWQATVYLEKGLSLHPKYSFTQNIGMDNSGENCSKTESFTHKSIHIHYNKHFPGVVEENILARQRLEAFFNRIKKPLWRKVISKFHKKLSKIIKVNK